MQSMSPAGRDLAQAAIPEALKRADAVCAIPIVGRIGSLNASVAGAIALWETARRRRVLRGSDSPQK